MYLSHFHSTTSLLSIVILAARFMLTPLLGFIQSPLPRPMFICVGFKQKGYQYTNLPSFIGFYSIATITVSELRGLHCGYAH